MGYFEELECSDIIHCGNEDSVSSHPLCGRALKVGGYDKLLFEENFRYFMKSASGKRLPLCLECASILEV